MTLDAYHIDSHKLHFHPDRVAEWMNGKQIAPLYMEISPSGTCNHRCRFCGMDFMGYKPRFLPTEQFCACLEEMGQCGVKAIMYAGEGEPFLHKEMGHIAQVTKSARMDVAFTTNAVNLGAKYAETVLPVTSWIKVSCNAGTRETYAHIHGTQASDFDVVMRNTAEAVRLREKCGSTCTLGFQMVLLPENRDEAVSLAQRVRDLGADYLVIKPYSIHRLSSLEEYRSLSYEDCTELAEQLQTVTGQGFSVIFRHEAMQRLKSSPVYSECLALPFWSYIDSGGSVWNCLRHIGENAFYGGNIFEASFAELIKKRNTPKGFAIADCHTDCRMDAINAYLWSLTHPGPHVNFI